MGSELNDYKILIVGRVAWTKNESTLTSIFSGFHADRLAYVCIETLEPNFDCCKQHFQISEFALLKRLFNWNTKTGYRVDENHSLINVKNKVKEQSLLHYVRGHRSIFYLYMRELLWLIGRWRSVELNQFIADFNPDVIFCISDPLPLMNRLQRYIIKKSGKPAAFFMMDDIYSYKTCHTLPQNIYRWLLRCQVRPLLESCNAHFAISPKMQRECDSLFGYNSVLLTKGIENESKPLEKVHQPIKLVYTGNLLYGRMRTLAVIARTLSSLNASGQANAVLNIYTQTVLNDEQRKLLEIEGVSHLYSPVAYDDLSLIYEQSDIVLFVESLEEDYKYIARLSFSTKLTDYLACGRCIFAVGANDTAPIEYLQEAKIAVTCGKEDDIETKLFQLLTNPNTIIKYAERAQKYGHEHHNSQLMHKRMHDTLCRII